MIPELQPVKSSNIHSLAHDGHNLFVRFHSAPDIWKYEGVSKPTFDEMMGSGSVGSYFAKAIRTAHKGMKVSP